MEPFVIPPLFKIAHFPKVNTVLMAQFCASDGLSWVRSLRCFCSEFRLVILAFAIRSASALADCFFVPASSGRSIVGFSDGDWLSVIEPCSTG